jgi:predicted ATP-dependent endonuclease of OLD family
MRVISRVQIESFRSIRRADLEGLSGFTAVAGLNNSGKSNVLRALNSFFNDQTDSGRAIHLDSDYHRPDLRKKKQKKIRVTVHFDLPDNFQFRMGLEGVEQLLGGRSFSITKEWTHGEPQAAFSLNGKPADGNETEKIKQFLNLIKFRYIPNRVLPLDVIRNEHQNLRDILIRRLSRRATRNQDAFEAIRDASQKIIGALNERFARACPGQGNVTLATPSSWRDLAFAFGYRLVNGEIQIEDIAQGSGVQSLLMLETLYLVDRDYFQQFGWRQAAIWAFEEPESSLHTSLEARVAAYLSEISSDVGSRLQILCTTHSDLVVQYAKNTFIVEQSNGQSTFRRMEDPKAALEELSRVGVSRWVHPILQFPLDPVVLVEGKFDVLFLEKAFSILTPRRCLRVADVSLLENTDGKSGLEKLESFLKGSAPAIRNRRFDAPVVVVLDWDASKKKQEFEKIVRDSPVYKVLVWPESATNPRLRPSFRGVERAYPDRIIEAAIMEGASIGKDKRGQYMVESQNYDSIKSQLAGIVRKGLTEDDIVHCKDFLREILSAAGAGGA